MPTKQPAAPGRQGRDDVVRVVVERPLCREGPPVPDPDRPVEGAAVDPTPALSQGQHAAPVAVQPPLVADPGPLPRDTVAPARRERVGLEQARLERAPARDGLLGLPALGNKVRDPLDVLRREHPVHVLAKAILLDLREAHLAQQLPSPQLCPVATLHPGHKGLEHEHLAGHCQGVVVEETCQSVLIQFEEAFCSGKLFEALCCQLVSHLLNSE